MNELIAIFFATTAFNLLLVCPLLIWKTLTFWKRRRIDYFARRRPFTVVCIVASVVFVEIGLYHAPIVQTSQQANKNNKINDTHTI